LDGDNPDQEKQSWFSSLGRLWSKRQRVSSEKELQEIIVASEEQGIINEDEGDMFHSIIEFGETIVREIMVPRTDMVSCGSESTLREVLDTIIESGHSRVPIFEGTNDRIVGFIYAKDLLQHWGEDPNSTQIEKVIRPPYFIPESKKIESLLQDFRTKRVHIAIVVDEYGGTSGLVTIEDLLEEIVGEIQDEYDEEEALLVEEKDGSLLVAASLPLDELEEYFDIEISREKFDTVGGYLIHLLDQVPEAGDDIVDGQLHMTVVESDDRKIHKVRIIRDANVEGTGSSS
jgi:magnesium and cobalt transporter